MWLHRSKTQLLFISSCLLSILFVSFTLSPSINKIWVFSLPRNTSATDNHFQQALKDPNQIRSIVTDVIDLKSEKKGFVDENPLVPDTSIVENVGGSCGSHPISQPEEVKPVEVEDEPPKSAYSVAIATGAAVASTAATANTTPYSGETMAEEAAIRIQTTFRGYLARRVLWDLRGLVRLKAVVEGPSVKRQTANTLKCTQNASHNGDEWNYSVQSKEQMEAKLLSKYEATMRRERAMAYSFSHQQPWKKSAGPPNLLFMDPTNPQWGWSWSERYMAARPWEPRAEKDPGNDHASVKTGITITRNEIAKSYARHQLNSVPSTPRSKAGGPLASRKINAGPSPQAFVSGVEANLDDDDSRSVVSVRSERNRRHSITGSTVKNDESLAGSPSARKHMVGSTKSAKAKQLEKGLSDNGGGSTAAASGGRTKKQLDFPGSLARPRPRRHSGPPKVETSICNELE
ncbi:IQ motif, EF-hand binding site-containing protein [Cynara cardunculus var. scolymus]|uniref:IQ motif, EF-hand binding site-containing protein n=1 Tax=Cynara cardunculus var. scolymus TaxID=59895 RepID=A0A124SBF7_CYNCS|nr:IQ motif, EF-hand binding site-containing protein [Cynara cardunculus var. scolymus]